MRPRRPALWLASLVLLLGGSAGEPAAADAAIARRLAALRALAGPASQTTGGEDSRSTGGSGCAAGAWWRTSAYARRERIESAIRDAARRYAVDEALIRSVIRHESAYDVQAVSHKGAMGLMQLMPATARELGVACAFDPRENVLGGSRYLRQLRDRLGSWPRAVAAYNAGPSRVESGRIPAETRRYLRRVLGSWRPAARSRWESEPLLAAPGR